MALGIKDFQPFKIPDTVWRGKSYTPLVLPAGVATAVVMVPQIRGMVPGADGCDNEPPAGHEGARGMPPGAPIGNQLQCEYSVTGPGALVPGGSVNVVTPMAVNLQLWHWHGLRRGLILEVSIGVLTAVQLAGPCWTISTWWADQWELIATATVDCQFEVGLFSGAVAGLPDGTPTMASNVALVSGPHK